MHPFSTPFFNHLRVFLCFQGVEKGCIGNKWVNMFLHWPTHRAYYTLMCCALNILLICFVSTVIVYVINACHWSLSNLRRITLCVTFGYHLRVNSNYCFVDICQLKSFAKFKFFKVLDISLEISFCSQHSIRLCNEIFTEKDHSKIT